MIGIDEHVIFIELYDLEIIVLCGETYDSLSEHVEANYATDLGTEQFIGQCAVASFSDFTCTIILAYVRKEINPGLIAHEVFHAIEEIANFYGLEGEALAYLTDYLNNNISYIFKEQLLYHYNKDT